MKNIWVKNIFKDNSIDDRLCIEKYKQMMDCINNDLRHSKCSEIISNWSECFEDFLSYKKNDKTKE